MKYYVYILYSESSDKFYIGSSEDPWKRLESHNHSEENTYTSKHRPWGLKAVFIAGENRGEALKAERFIKKQKSKNLLQKLISPSFEPDGALAQLVRVPPSE